MREEKINKPSIKYDENNNIIYIRNFIEDESWCDYDENNNLIHYEDSNGDEIICI